MKKFYVKKLKKATAGILAATCVLSVGTEVLAASTTFSHAKVDSNKWKSITKAKKSSTSGFCSVTVDEIYDEDGDECDYSKVKVTCYYGNNVAVTKSSYTATEGKMCIMQYKNGYNIKGRETKLKAKGNNPKLDCEITGAFNAD